MKIEVKNETPNENKIVYPCLLIDDYETVILATDSQYGALLRKGDRSENLGEITDYSCEDDWRLFVGEITLSNE